MTEQIQKPLVEAMQNYVGANPLRMHMPGHKGKTPNFTLGKSWGQAWQYDLTEATGLDNLNAPTAAIMESEKRLAALYRSKKAHFLINGATVGLQAAIMASCHQGDKIIVPRNAHRSIWSAIALCGAVPVWLPVFQHPGLALPLGVATETVAQAITENPEAKAIVFTYPTYHGLCGDLKKMARLAGQKGIFTIVDESHGAHFAFTGWPDMAVDSGAAIVVQGWHKTMGSLTQTGVMLQNDTTYPVEKYLAMLQSSSPSYLLMASLEEARANWEENRDDLARIMLRNAGEIRAALGDTNILTAIKATDLPWPVADYDLTRIVIYSKQEHTGWQIQQALAKTGIEVEMADSKTVVLITTYQDTEADIQRLAQAMIGADEALAKITPTPVPFVNFGELPLVVMTPAESLAKEQEWVSLEQAIDRVAADLLVPYPPGIPVVGMGERISEEVVAGLEFILEEGGRIQGLVNGLVSVVK